MRFFSEISKMRLRDFCVNKSDILMVFRIVFLLFAISSCSTNDGVRIKFDQVDAGPLSLINFPTQEVGHPRWIQGGAGSPSGERLFVVDLGNGSKALKANFSKNSYGAKNSGGQWMLDIPPSDQYYFEYELSFSDNFDWARGGKLPGLAGGSAPTGGKFDPHGFTSRYMWRENGRLVLYLYWAGQRSKGKNRGLQFGQDFDTGILFEKNKKYRLKQHIVLNKIGQKNGSVTVWVDDKVVVKLDGLVFRLVSEESDWFIDKVFFSTFYGGGDVSWAPSVDTSIYFYWFNFYR